MDYSSLKYSDENDRAHGLAGMAVAMVAYNAQDYIVSISLDTNPGEGFSLAPEFGFNGNPRLSAKLAWKQMLEQFELSAAMIMGNAVCRACVGQRQRPSAAVVNTLHTLVADEGHQCELDDDEIERLFNKNMNYITRLFTHPGVMSVTTDFVTAVKSRRSLTAAEILDRLSALHGL